MSVTELWSRGHTIHQRLSEARPQSYHIILVHTHWLCPSVPRVNKLTAPLDSHSRSIVLIVFAEFRLNCSLFLGANVVRKQLFHPYRWIEFMLFIMDKHGHNVVLMGQNLVGGLLSHSRCTLSPIPRLNLHTHPGCDSARCGAAKIPRLRLTADCWLPWLMVDICGDKNT